MVVLRLRPQCVSLATKVMSKLGSHHLLVRAASDGDKTKAPIEVEDLGVRRFAETGGERAKGGTARVAFFVLGFGALGGLANGRGLLEDDALDEEDDLVLVLLMLSEVGKDG